MSAFAIAAVGEVCADLYEGDDEVYLGGISGNFARSAAAAGARASVFAAVGDDERGAALLALLAKTGVEPRIRVLPGRTAVQRIRSAPDGERIFCGFDAGVVADYMLTVDELAALARFDALAIPLAPETARVVAQLAADRWCHPGGEHAIGKGHHLRARRRDVARDIPRTRSPAGGMGAFWTRAGAQRRRVHACGCGCIREWRASAHRLPRVRRARWQRRSLSPCSGHLAAWGHTRSRRTARDALLDA